MTFSVVSKIPELLNGCTLPLLIEPKTTIPKAPAKSLIIPLSFERLEEYARYSGVTKYPVIW